MYNLVLFSSVFLLVLICSKYIYSYIQLLDSFGRYKWYQNKG